MSWPWNELGLSGPAGLPEIRRAYAQRLKTTHPEEDPEGFQRLHTAYQEASRYARRQRRAAPEPDASRLTAREDDSPETAEPSNEAAWDYGQRFEGQEPPPEEQDESKKGDRGRLLEEVDPKEPEAPKEAEAGWDYERLFAEGEAEAQEARRRKLEELRRKNKDRLAAQEREQRKRAADEEESWAAVCAAAHALELLYSSSAPLSQWRRFLNDPLFWNVRANLDFVFALEDFLEQHPDLSPEIRRAIFAAYESENASRYGMYNQLYRLLNVDRREKRRAARDKSAWRAAWRSYPSWRKACIVVCFSILGSLALFVVGLSVRDSLREAAEKRAAEQWEANILDWLEEDYGEPFILAVRDNIYAPESEPALYFWVTPDGERTEDWPGYRTDYPHIRIKQAMESFAKVQGLELTLDSAGGFSGGIGNAPGAYLFDLPLLGAEASISALGELVDELRVQDWYRTPEDQYGGSIEYQIFLCHSGLSFYDAISTDAGGFDTELALMRYQGAGPAFCRYILENSGLAGQHMGEGTYTLLDQGMVEIDGQSFFQVAGFSKETAEPQAEYLMATGGGMLFCLPEGTLVSRITDLYRGSVSHLQLDGVGLVTVMDQIKTE